MTLRGIAPVASCALLAIVPLIAQTGKVERGRYLVVEVAKCADCHTPMSAGGPDMSRWLKGGELGFQPIQPVKGWHKAAPDITSSSRLFQRWGEAGMVKFMETGLGPRGNKADPPMPAYKLTHEDAEAVVAYLKSLK